MGEKWKGFRTLRADEIDCRVGTAREKGCSILLYKDARVDMTLLDEAFGPFGWERSHELIDGDLYCTIRVRNPETGEWVSKQDVGTESTTEKEKGRASDSFKRAAVNWGIGRELYTSPFVWIAAQDCKITQGRNGNPTCYDNFRVTRIEYNDARRISALEIVNDSRKGALVFSYGAGRKGARKAADVKEPAEAIKTPARAAERAKTGTASEAAPIPSPAYDFTQIMPPSVNDKITEEDWAEIQEACAKVGVKQRELLNRYQLSSPIEITYGLRDDMIAFLSTYKG